MDFSNFSKSSFDRGIQIQSTGLLKFDYRFKKYIDSMSIHDPCATARV